MNESETIDMPARVEVGSQLLKGIAYHPESQTLEVQFKKSGTVYRYHRVAPDSFQKLMHAESIGAHFLKTIKDAHDFTRVSED